MTQRGMRSVAAETAAPEAPPAVDAAMREQLARELSPEEYRRIRRLWVKHSIAEDRRDLDGLIATLTPDCVYEILSTHLRWEGHDGARAFYTAFLGAFPDVTFHLTDIVIGPQGVIEIAMMRGTHLGPWDGVAASGQPVACHIVIHFPWDRAARKFSGERIALDRPRPGILSVGGAPGQPGTLLQQVGGDARP